MKYKVSHSLSMPKGCNHPDLNLTLAAREGKVIELTPALVIFLRKINFKVIPVKESVPITNEAPKPVAPQPSVADIFEKVEEVTPVADEDLQDEDDPVLVDYGDDEPEEGLAEEAEVDFLSNELEPVPLDERSREELMDMCKERGLKAVGNKRTLISRLKKDA